jgi:hypothetical protein
MQDRLREVLVMLASLQLGSVVVAAFARRSPNTQGFNVQREEQMWAAVLSQPLWPGLKHSHRGRTTLSVMAGSPGQHFHKYCCQIQRYMQVITQEHGITFKRCLRGVAPCSGQLPHLEFPPGCAVAETVQDTITWSDGGTHL